VLFSLKYGGFVQGFPYPIYRKFGLF